MSEKAWLPVYQSNKTNLIISPFELYDNRINTFYNILCISFPRL